VADSGLAELARIGQGLNADLSRLNRQVGHQIGRVGNEEVRAEYTKLFGGDHKFSGAQKSKKARRKATVRYRVSRDSVEIIPSGDPIYIFMMGRGRTRIRPRKKKALATPVGVYSTVLGGRLEPRPQSLDPAERRIADKSARVVSLAVDLAIRRALR
jgi:hypothetical protein